MNNPQLLSDREILDWLRESDETRLEELWALADEARRRHVGDAVHLRGLVEISNHCVRQCAYCGLRAGHAALPRYRMNEEEILECARQAVAFGYGTLVMQAGEDPGLTREWVAGLVRRIKRETPLAVTLSLGERPPEDLAAWREAGADRYLLRFETSDVHLYRRIHPEPNQCGMRNAECGILPGSTDASDSSSSQAHIEHLTDNDSSIPHSAFRIPHSNHPRIAMLQLLRNLGYEVGSGVMAGIPGQTYASLGRDLELFRALDLDMIGIGPYLPHPDTPLGRVAANAKPAAPGQVPPTELMTYKMVALARLVCPQANIPSTTALATLNKAEGRELGLARGANVVMPNLTPPRYRELYTIYPDKACIHETAEACAGCLAGRILSLGRTIGRGPGSRPR